MAKVMISIPDDLLERIDSRAEANSESRSGFLQRVAERELELAELRRREEIVQLLELATGSMGGEAVKLIREDRDSR